MATYHARLPDQMIQDRQELLRIIRGQRIMTLALCMDNEPYLVTMNFGFDEGEDCFYFHCAGKGKKIDYLRANPVVWGQVMQDDGYVQGRCNHTYHSVQFKGQVTFLESIEEKAEALTMMIEQMESDPAPVKKRLIRESRLQNVAVGRVHVIEMTGKANLL